MGKYNARSANSRKGLAIFDNPCSDCCCCVISRAANNWRAYRQSGFGGSIFCNRSGYFWAFIYFRQ